MQPWNVLAAVLRLALILCAVSLPALALADTERFFRDDFNSAHDQQWTAVSPSGDATASEWNIAEGLLRRTGSNDSLFDAATSPTSNRVVDARVRVRSGGRTTFGVALRRRQDGYLLIRYYDQPQALEVLDFRGREWTPIGERSTRLPVESGHWLRMKVAVVDDSMFAKLWPEVEAEPDWQLTVKVPGDSPDSGGFALVAHDDTSVEFDYVSAASEGEPVDAIRAAERSRRDQQAALIAAGLQMRVTPRPAIVETAGSRSRRMRLVLFLENDRLPVAGRLTVRSDDDRGEVLLTKDLTIDDFELGGFDFDVPEPPRESALHVAYEIPRRKMTARVELDSPVALSWRDCVRSCLDTLILHGRDDYGTIKSPLFMAVLDADTLRSPERPYPLDALVRLEGRLHRRGERGANLWYDQALLKALYRMTELTGDSKYENAADEYAGYYLAHCRKTVDPQHIYLNGMPAWGTHVYWDCYQDRPTGDGDGNGPHEILVFRAEWPTLYRIAPQQVRRMIEGIWEYHVVDKSSGLHNRHDDRRQGCDFAFSGGSLAHASAFMHQATGNVEYLARAKTIAGWHWNNRDPNTQLTADCPGLKERYDGNHCFTTVAGPHASALLECYALTGDGYFRDAAVTYIKGYDRYAWAADAGTYYAMLALDGTPQPDREKGPGYDAYAPYGHVNVWRTTFYSYEFTLSAAQAAVQAYETTLRDGTPDKELLTIAQRWASVVEHALPAHTGRRWKAELEQQMPRAVETSGAYAEDYGRAISLFVHLARVAKQPRSLEVAEQIAADAVAKLFYQGLFLGHPAKPYYETTNGVGLLLVALLELDAPADDLGGAF